MLKITKQRKIMLDYLKKEKHTPIGRDDLS